jgi:Gram-negative bacterial TonB protein C-terminal/PilZ domain
MTKLQDSQAGSIARPHELRLHPRRKLAGMAYVELTQDNGGILLNLSEGGFAIQSALALSSSEFPDLRFQLPNMRGWLTGSGRVVWISESKKEAGIQFLDLHEHARAQIRMWVGKDGLSEPETAASAAGNGSPVGVGAEMSHAEAVRTSQAFLGARNAGAERAGAQSYGAAPLRHSGSTSAEDDRSFRFNDYSMFAADPNGNVTWAEPIRQKRGWGSYVLFTILLAALFFVLGAMMGRDNLSGLVVDGWKRIQGEEPPSTKAPAPPASTESSTPSGSDGQSSAVPSTPSGNGSDTASSATQGAASNGTITPTQPGNSANVPASNAASEPKGPGSTADGEVSAPKQSSADNGAGLTAAAASSSPSSTATKASGDPAPSRARERNAVASKNGTLPRGDASYSNADAAGSNEYGRSILVTAPAPGSPPFFVHLPGEPVSASSSVAISARRSIQVPPRAYDGGYGTQRMVVGKLLAHSDPYYPVDARAKHIEGIVELHALVGRSGEVLKITPVSGPGVLLAASVTALREWRYEPTFINGDPVETQVDVTMVFRSH